MGTNLLTSLCVRSFMWFYFFGLTRILSYPKRGAPWAFAPLAQWMLNNTRIILIIFVTLNKLSFELLLRKFAQLSLAHHKYYSLFIDHYQLCIYLLLLSAIRIFIKFSSSFQFKGWSGKGCTYVTRFWKVCIWSETSITLTIGRDFDFLKLYFCVTYTLYHCSPSIVFRAQLNSNYPRRGQK